MFAASKTAKDRTQDDIRGLEEHVSRNISRIDGALVHFDKRMAMNAHSATLEIQKLRESHSAAIIANANAIKELRSTYDSKIGTFLNIVAVQSELLAKFQRQLELVDQRMQKTAHVDDVTAALRAVTELNQQHIELTDRVDFHAKQHKDHNEGANHASARFDKLAKAIEGVRADVAANPTALTLARDADANARSAFSAAHQANDTAKALVKAIGGLTAASERQNKRLDEHAALHTNIAEDIDAVTLGIAKMASNVPSLESVNTLTARLGELEADDVRNFRAALATIEGKHFDIATQVGSHERSLQQERADRLTSDQNIMTQLGGAIDQTAHMVNALAKAGAEMRAQLSAGVADTRLDQALGDIETLKLKLQS